MAISIRSVSDWTAAASGTMQPNSALPHSVGDMLITRLAYKSSSIATDSITDSGSDGWTKVGEFHDGTTNSGNGTGSVGVTAWWKIATSTSSEVPSLQATGETQYGTCQIAYQKAADETWDTPVGDGGGYVAGTNISATIQSHVSVVAGDMVDFFHSARDDSTATVPTITQTGVTYDTVAESPATALANTTGADGTYDGGYRLATAGTSSAAAVVTGTLSTSESGSAWMTRLRVTVAAEPRVPRLTPYPQILAH